MKSDIESALLGTLTKLSEAGFSIGVGFRGAEPHWVRATYSRAWVDNYVAKSYIQIDPTIQFGLTQTGHITWSQLGRRHPETESFFGDAKGYGLKDGNTLSIRSSGGISILSCSGPKWQDDEIKRASAALHGLAALHSTPENMQGVALNEREKDVLRLMCSGLKDQDIADVLGVKVETVRARRRKAMQATDTSTIAQLISEVTKKSLI